MKNKGKLKVSEMLFINEYCGPKRTAWVCRRRNMNDYVTIGYIDGLERMAHPFPTEAEAKDYAENWVLLNNE